jgi:hypothetical protein
MVALIESDRIFNLKVGIIFTLMRVAMVLVIPTGRRSYFSITRLPLISTTILPKYYSSPKVARELEELLMQGHWLIHICQKISDGWTSHKFTI